MCGEACEKGLLHSNYECLAFQEVGYKVDSNDANEAVGKVLGEKEKGNGEIFRDIKSYRSHIEGGGFSPYCFISTLRCILMKGKNTNLQNQDYAYFHNAVIEKSSDLTISASCVTFTSKDKVPPGQSNNVSKIRSILENFLPELIYRLGST